MKFNEKLTVEWYHQGAYRAAQPGRSKTRAEKRADPCVMRRKTGASALILKMKRKKEQEMSDLSEKSLGEKRCFSRGKI